jgi:hypothetical protein
MRPDDPLERLARRIVADELGVTVTLFDDGSAPRMPDALIHLEAGPAPLEVVRDDDQRFEQLWAELKRQGSVLRTDLPSSWYITLNNRAHVRRLRATLPRILATWPPAETIYGYDEIPPALERLGVVDVREFERGERGLIVLSHEGWNSWDDPIELNEWVARVFTKAPDVPAKLEAHGGEQRHAFIWARDSSAWNVMALLVPDDDDDARLPVHGPTLPAGVTHVWVASTRTRRGCLLLEGDRWRRTGWITADDSLDEDPAPA